MYNIYIYIYNIIQAIWLQGPLFQAQKTFCRTGGSQSEAKPTCRVPETSTVFLHLRVAFTCLSASFDVCNTFQKASLGKRRAARRFCCHSC